MLLIATPAWTLEGPCEQPALDQVIQSTSQQGGGEIDLDGCGTIPAVDMSGTAHVILDFKSTSIDAANAPYGIQMVGSQGDIVRNVGGLINASQGGILASLDAVHCGTREQGNHVFENISMNLASIKGSVGYIFEGSEQNTIQNSPLVYADQAGVLLWGANAGPVPFTSSDHPVCPTGQTMTETRIFQASFASNNHAIIAKGTINTYTQNLYTVCNKQSPNVCVPGVPKAAILFDGLNSGWYNVAWENEGYTKLKMGPVAQFENWSTFPP